VFGPTVDNLVAQLTRLPGIGTRTAQRLAFHLLSVSREEAGALAAAIVDAKERVRFCRDCGNLTEEELCAICRDGRREHSVICVVEQPVDVISLERTPFCSTRWKSSSMRRCSGSTPSSGESEPPRTW
jgi:recombination protein RecR